MRKHLQHGAISGRALVGGLVAGFVAFAGLTAAAVEAQGEPTSVHRKSAAVEAVRAEIKTVEGATTFVLGLSSGVRAEIFTLASPFRVVIDLPDVAFQLSEGIGQKGQGLISSFRYGLLSEGKARVVLDASGPVVIK